MRKRTAHIMTDNIPSLLIKLTLPSIAGMLGLMIFNIVDTWFVGRLGTTELAAISFTFPVVMIINSVLIGFGTAVMTLFSRAAGSQNEKEERLLATSSLVLGVILSLILSITGWLTIEPLFRLLGVSNELMPLVTEYMRVWYVGVCFVVFPMFGDGILRGLGDTLTPAFVMLCSAIVNIILDPLLIFGIGPFPAMGIAGAAIATVFARMLSTVISLTIQIKREKLITFRGIGIGDILKEWKSLFFLGIPNAAIKIIIPLGSAIFTSILARYGNVVVAGYGVAAKIESLIIAVPNALSVTAAVFAGQNLGARKTDRVQKGIRCLYLYGLLYGAAAAILLALSGGFLGSLFNENPLVRQTTTLYLMIVPFGYGLYSVAQTGASILNVYHKPLHAGILSLIQIGGIAVPLAYLLSGLWNQTGLFTAILISNLAIGLMTLPVVRLESGKILQGEYKKSLSIQESA